MKTICSVVSLLVCAHCVTMYPVEFTEYGDIEADYPYAYTGKIYL